MEKGRRVEIERLPAYVKMVGDKLEVVGKVEEGERGLYDEVYDHGFLCESLKDEVSLEDRWDPENFFSAQSMLEVSEIVLESGGLPRNAEDSFGYQQCIYDVICRGTDRLLREIRPSEMVLYPPLNGGESIAAMMWSNLRERGYRNFGAEQIAHFELKRIHMEDGRFLVGARYHYMPENNGRVTVIADDCMATDASVTSILEKLGRPGEVKVLVATASQRSAETVLDRYGIPVIAGSYVYKVAANGYLMRTEQEGFPSGSYYVSDMGRWLKELPGEFDDEAPWNRMRKQLREEWAALE